jgi:acyl carrier protein
LTDGSAGFVELTRDELEGSLPGRFERIAARAPDAPAIVWPEGVLTYGALNPAANRLARAILARRGPASAPVVVLVDHDPSAVVAILATLKAGKVYLALEASPIERELSRIWADALGLDEIGIHDDFFELGGHSLLAASLVARVREAFGVDLSAAALLEAPQVSGMATVIVEHLLRTLSPGARERLLDGLEAPEAGRGAAQPVAATDAPAPDAR